MLKFSFSGADGIMAVPETLTSGMIGKEVCFSFSEEWEGLSKVVVFSSGKVKRDVVLNDSVILIPPEVLEIPMRYLYVGVYGVSGDGTLVIPTIRVKGPFIEAGTDPSGAPGTNPTLEVWAQMLSAVGDLMNLETENKSSLVAAINELVVQSMALSSIGDPAQLTTGEKDTLVAAINELNAKAENGLTETEKTLILTLFRNSSYASDMSGTIGQLEELWNISEEEDTHVHSYTSTLTTAATCTTAGQRTYICACGDSYEETIPALGHDYVDGVCTVCGAEETPSGSVLLYNWDLTSSLTDTLGGVTATLGGSAAQDENGLTISAADGSCYFGSDIFSPGRSFEVDVASAIHNFGSENGFLIMIETSGVNAIGKAGLTYRRTGQWQIYDGSAWRDTEVTISDSTAITGKTVRFVSESETVYSVYIGDVKLSTVTMSENHQTTLQIGAVGLAFHELVVTAVRVYGEAA